MANNEEKKLPPRVLYCDDSLAVVYKNRGEVCESDATDPSLSLINNVLGDLEAVVGKKIDNPEAVHRIDQPVTGCVLIAFDKDVHASLSAQFAAGKIRKKYLAIVERNPSGSMASGGETNGRLEHMLRFDHKHHKATVVGMGDEIRKPGGEWKKAVLEWRLAGSGDRYLFLEVIPQTGRTHQIRAQLAAAGMAIKGDLKYGARRSDPLGGIRLHAYSIQFTHPVTNNVITVTAPMQDPDNLWNAFGALA